MTSNLSKPSPSPATTPFHVADFKSFAAAVQTQYAARDGSAKPPGRVQTLNLLCKAAGFKNYAHFLAQAQSVLPTPGAQDKAALSATVQKALLQFDESGLMVRFPVKRSVQKLIVWALWLRFDGKRRYTEAEVNAVLKAAHVFGDHATLRRELINEKLLARKSDCSAYWKLAARPQDDALGFVREYKRRYGA